MLETLSQRLSRRPESPFFARDLGESPSKRYLVATTARSGSTLLCSRISEYGRLGYPNEFLNESYITEFDRLFPDPSLSDFERYVARSFTSDTGVFGMKTDWWRFSQARNLNLFRSFYDPLDLVAYLRRDDFVAQAVSLSLALETQVWHVAGGEDADVTARHSSVAYDAAKIELQACNILNQEYYWAGYLKACGAPVVSITYEQLEENLDGAVQIVADALGVGLEARSFAPKVEKLRSTVAASWCEQFREEKADFVRFWTQYRGLSPAST